MTYKKGTRGECLIHHRIRCGECEYVEELKSENKRFRKALEFYADDYKWIEENKGSPYMPDYRMEIQDDGGDIARQALEGDSK